jgi:hypothetical protein
MMEKVSISETSVRFYETAWRSTPEDGGLCVATDFTEGSGWPASHILATGSLPAGKTDFLQSLHETADILP